MQNQARRAPRECSSTRRSKACIRRQRVWMILGGVLLWTGLLSFRLFQLQIENGADWLSQARKQQSGVFKIAPERGAILDRSGNLLAVSVPAGSVYARPAKLKDRSRAAKLLAAELGLEESQLLESFNGKSPFVWVKRQVPRAKAEQVQELGLKGVGYLIEPKRYYPYGEAASTLIGRVGVDGKGLSGLEARYEKRLRASRIEAAVRRDALGKFIPASLEDFTKTELPRGQGLQLTLDADFQLILDEELRKVHAEREAKGAYGILIDPDSGEILALGQAPSANFNESRLSSKEVLKNLAIETVYEPGSIVKPMVAAGLIERGIITPQDLIDCQGGQYRFGKHTINDVKPVDTVSFHEVVVRSSNIGMTQAAMRAGKRQLHSVFTSFGFGKSSGLRLPGESPGILRSPSNWAEVDIATHAYGQGVAVNALQLVRAFSSLVNGGNLPALKLIANEELAVDGAETRRVLSAATAHQVKRILFDVVNAPHGTGKKAFVEGLVVGGKTGTAQKAMENGRGYKKGEYITSFIGFAEGVSLGLRRSLVLLISVDEPQGTFRYGGTVAAPVFRSVMSRIYHKLLTRQNTARGPFGDFRKATPVSYRG